MTKFTKFMPIIGDIDPFDEGNSGWVKTYRKAIEKIRKFESDYEAKSINISTKRCNRKEADILLLLSSTESQCVTFQEAYLCSFTVCFTLATHYLDTIYYTAKQDCRREANYRLARKIKHIRLFSKYPTGKMITVVGNLSEQVRERLDIMCQEDL